MSEPIRYAVGYQLPDDRDSILELVQDYPKHINEVYFAWLGQISGRTPVGDLEGFSHEEALEVMTEELGGLSKLGVKLTLLCNANCYGGEAASKTLARKTEQHVEQMREQFNISAVTTASPYLARVIKQAFPDLEIRASVNMRIGTVKGMEYMADLFDSFHVQRDYNRDLSHLRMLKEWADGAGKKLILLANSGCFSFCSGQTFHDNMVAHEAEICEIKNLDDFNPYVCWQTLKNREKWHMLLQNTWIRPEDLHHYEELFDTVKLATRMHALPGLVIGAYARRYHCGNTLDLFEPGLGRAISPYIIDNMAFPEDWFERTSSCDKNCHKCNYCKSVLEKVLLNTEGMEDEC